jgi:hypothetical protein
MRKARNGTMIWSQEAVLNLPRVILVRCPFIEMCSLFQDPEMEYAEDCYMRSLDRRDDRLVLEPRVYADLDGVEW